MVFSEQQYDYIEELTDNVKEEFEKYSETLENKDGFYEAMYELECHVYDTLYRLEKLL